MTACQPGEVTRSIGVRLRAVRQERGLSLREVEAQSGGEFRAAILRAYETGERAISLERLAALAELYRTSIAALWPEAAALPPLVAEAFAAITACKDAEMARMAAQYEAEIAVLRAEREAV